MVLRVRSIFQGNLPNYFNVGLPFQVVVFIPAEVEASSAFFLLATDLKHQNLAVLRESVHF